MRPSAAHHLGASTLMPVSNPKVNMKEATPSQQIKKLHRRHGNNHTLKDYAVDLGANGTASEKALVNSWFHNKRPEPGARRDAPKKVVVAPEPLKKAANGKKR